MMRVSQASKFEAYKNVFHGEGRTSVAVSTGERKVSEKVGMLKAGMPILSLVMVISWLREGGLEEDQKRGECLIWARILEF